MLIVQIDGLTRRLFVFSLVVVAFAGIAAYVREMLRGAVARAILERQQADERHRQEDHSYWYTVDLTKLPDNVSALFRRSEEDFETAEFLQNCYEKADSFLLQLYHSLVLPILKMFMTQTSANGFLGRGSMFVLSGDNFRKLTGKAAHARSGSLIDLGAGDGKVTVKMAQHFEAVYATETSGQMQWRLQQLGYGILGVDEWDHRQYDLISCLNVLDRCDKPLTLLRKIRHALASGGKAIIALVLPFSTYVESTASKNPSEGLDIRGKTKEEQIATLVALLQAESFVVEAFTRVPYLCEGDMTRSFYVLDDYVFVLSRKD